MAFACWRGVPDTGSRIGIQRKRVEWPIADAASFLPEASDPRPAPTCGASGPDQQLGTYFDFTAEKIEAMADEASTLGIELFVLDDGWFGKRDDDYSSLGDWHVHTAKLPSGLKQLAENIKAKGMLFGLWFEPEMISEDSELFRAHPDWCIHTPGRENRSAAANT